MPSLTNKTFLDDAGLQAIWGKITNKCATKEEFNKLKGCFYDSNYVYSTSKAYNNGDYAVYDGVLYICTDDVTAGTWAENSDSFSQITSLSVLQTLTAAFSLQAETVSGLVTDVGHIKDTISGSADEYSASKPYSAGDMVMHDGTLYKCTDDVAAGPWSTNYDSFESETVVSTFNDMKSSFQGGCDTIVTAVTAKGQTPSSNSPTDIATAIGNISTGKSLTVTVTGLHTGKTYLDVRVKIKYGTNEVTTTVNSSCVAAFGIDSSYTGDLVIEATDDYKYYTQKITISSNSTYTATMPLKNVYGLLITSSTGNNIACKRILSASDKSFTSSYNGSSGNSDFDSIMPWSGMTVVDDSVAGKMVRIPKYYYRIRNGEYHDILNLSYSISDGPDATVIIEISSEPMYGFYTSYGHIDRGDGAGERDYIYVSRYFCNSSYKSQTGTAVLRSINPVTARTNIHNLGNEYWIQDYLTYFTYILLYIVETGSINGNLLGYAGVATAGTSDDNGLTDNMPYCSGTVAASKSKYGALQYRNIEGFGSNGLAMIDGIKSLYKGTRPQPSKPEVTQTMYVPTINLNPATNSSFDSGINLYENLTFNQIGAGTSFSNRLHVYHVNNIGYFVIPMIQEKMNNGSLLINNNIFSHTNSTSFWSSDGTDLSTYVYTMGSTPAASSNSSMYGIFSIWNNKIKPDGNSATIHFKSIAYRIMKLPS